MKPYHDLSSIELLLDNLTLLGFDLKHDASSPVFEKLIFDTTLFATSDHNNNRRAFECLSYFLFTRLDHEQTQTRFASCWPIQDHTSTGRVFRMVTYHWLLELWEQRWLLGPVTLRRSQFETCGDGAALLDITVSLSVLVLQTVIDRDLADPKGRPLRLLPASVDKSDDSIEDSLDEAIQALAHYCRQQKDDFATWTLEARDKVRGMQRRLDSERESRSSKQSTVASPKATMKNIRTRLVDLKHRQSGGGSPATTALRVNEATPVRTFSNKDCSPILTLPSLITQRDLDPVRDIQRIQSFVQQYIDTNGLP